MIKIEMMTIIETLRKQFFFTIVTAADIHDDHDDVHDHRRRRRSAEEEEEEHDHGHQDHVDEELPGCYSAHRILDIFGLPDKGISHQDFYR